MKKLRNGTKRNATLKLYYLLRNLGFSNDSIDDLSSWSARAAFVERLDV